VIQLKLKFNQFRIWLADIVMRMLRVDNLYRTALNEAILEIKGLRADVLRLDRKNAIDVRGSLDLINFDSLGEIVWIKVADDRMLRADVFNQIRDYLRGHRKDHSILLLTGSNVELQSLTDDDLQRSGLQRVRPNELPES